MREESKGHYEMLWDCAFCDTPRLLGLTHRHCPNCGAAQDPARRYFPPDSEKIAVEDHQYAGKDKLCPACDNPIAAACTFCGQCGSPVDGAGEVKVRREQHAANGAFAADSLRAAEAEHRGEAPPKPARSRKRLWLVLLIIAAVVIAVVYGLCFWNKEARLEVTDHTWKRTIAIEEFARVTESAWRDRTPRDAVGIRCRLKKRSTRKVPDGETCTTKRVDKGDGTFEEVQKCKPKYREEPVEDEWCTFTVQRWKVAETLEASGRGREPAPTWPTVSLTGPRTGLGARREGARQSRYTLHVKDPEGKTHTCDVTEEMWRRHDRGAALVGEIGRVSGSLDCDTLAPAK